MASIRRARRTEIIGTGVDAITLAETVEEIVCWTDQGRGGTVFCRDSRGLVLCRDDPDFRRHHQTADLVTPDGMPLVYLLKLKRGWSRVTRVYGPDLMIALCQATSNGRYRHYLFGSTPRVCKQLGQALQSRCPGLAIAGVLSPPFTRPSAEEDKQMIAAIRDAAPHFVWVGLGSPKQERWIAAHGCELPGMVLLGVGAAFDFVAGAKRQAPWWMRSGGMEWAYRFLQEPRRLWRRNLIDNPRFLWLVLREHTTGLPPLD